MQDVNSKLRQKIKIIFFSIFILFSLTFAEDIKFPINYQNFCDLIKVKILSILNANSTKKYILSTFYISAPEKIYVPLNYNLDIKFEKKVSSNCQNIIVRVYSPLGNKTYYTFPGVFCFKTLIKAYKAKHFIKKGDIIKKEDVEPTYVPDFQKNYIVRNLKEIIGKEAKVNIRPGQIIYKYYLEKPRLVHRGDIIHLIAYNNGIFVDIQVLALSSGGRGDFIFVKNPSSGKVLRCKIIDKGICFFQIF